MNYEASQTLVSDLLGDGTNFDLHNLSIDAAQEDVGDADDALHAPGLWSDSESASEDSRVVEAPPRIQENSLDQLRGDVRQAVRFKSRRAKKPPKKGRIAQETEPTFEIQGMLGRANQSFVNKDLNEAQDILEEVIRIDYNVFAAWQTLGEVHKDRGDLDKCLTAWMIAAHLRPKDGDMWYSVANLSAQLSHLDQADYCYNKLARARPQDVDVLWDRADFNREHGRNRKAIEIFKQLLKLIPFEMSTVRELAKLYVEEDRADEALSLYEDTSNYYMSMTSEDLFNWSELNIMAELYMTAAESSKRSEDWRTMIARVKVIARWLRGRQFETWWSDRDDDAEWDHDDLRRKSESKYAASTSVEAFTLPVELHIKLGRARLMLKEKSEALRHFDFLDAEGFSENPDLILDVADALLRAESWDEALEFYSKLIDIDEMNTPDLWLSMAKAFRATEDYAQAEECLDAVIASETENSEAIVLLAEIYENTDRRQDALEAINRVIELRRAVDAEDTGTMADDHSSACEEEQRNSVEAEATSALKQAAKRRPRRKKGRSGRNRKEEDLVEFENRKTAETRTQFKALELSNLGMLASEPEATEQWMSAASDLVDDFKNIRHFYPSDKKNTFQGIIKPSRGSRASDEPISERLQGIADRLEDSLTAAEAVSKSAVHLDHFRGFLFSEWLDVFLQYALLLIKSGELSGGYSVLEAAAGANVFYQDHARFMRIHMTKMVLTISAGDSKAGAEQARWIMLHCLFREDGYKLYGAAMSSGLIATREYNENSNQKFMLRLVKTMDSLLSGSNIAGTISVKDIDQNSECVRPDAVQPNLLILYGHIIAIGRGYAPSLHYFVRAFAQCPSDPLLLFSIGLAYLHRSMQRQSDNRHLQIMQAFSFLLRYYDVRKTNNNPGHLQEAEFNLGRALHQLGLLHLALRHYEKVLEVQGVDVKYDLTRSTVYNMQLIYVLSGNPRKARELVVKYLSI